MGRLLRRRRRFPGSEVMTGDPGITRCCMSAWLRAEEFPGPHSHRDPHTWQSKLKACIADSSSSRTLLQAAVEALGITRRLQVAACMNPTPMGAVAVRAQALYESDCATGQVLHAGAARRGASTLADASVASRLASRPASKRPHAANAGSTREQSPAPRRAVVVVGRGLGRGRTSRRTGAGTGSPRGSSGSALPSTPG